MSSRYTAVVIDLPDEFGVVQIRRVQATGDNFLGQVVGGYLEHLATSDGSTDFWMNEEGKLHGLPLNHVATDLLRELYPWTPEQVWPGGPGEPMLVGNVVITGNRGPETASVPDGVWEKLHEMAGPTGVWTTRAQELPVWLGPVAFTDEEP